MRAVAALMACFMLSVSPAFGQQIVKIEKVRSGAVAVEDTAPASERPRFTRIKDTWAWDFHMGMGASWGDYNVDGLPDLFVSGYYRHPDLLYRNKGDGTFAKAETEAGVDAGRAAGFGCGWADYDNDGDQDLYVVNVNEEPDFLWQNDGEGHFRNVAAEAGMGQKGNHYGAAWADFDGDAHLDLFLVGGAQNALFQNRGNGTFLDIAAGAGIVESSVQGYGVAWGDYDGDKDLDIYVTRGGQDFLYRNNGNGTFKNVAADVGMAENVNGQGAAWGDYDNDGDLDLYVANYGDAQDFLYRNNGDGTFAQVAEKSGMRDSLRGRGVAWGDYDNDGDLDLVVANDASQPLTLYRNNGDGTFANVAKQEGLEGGWCIGAGWADYDNDGDLDLFIGTQVTHVDLFYRNEDTGANGWIKVNPLTRGAARGRAQVVECPHCGTKFNPATREIVKSDAGDGAPYRLAIGAWVEIDLDGGADFRKGPGRYVAALVGAGDGLGNSAIPVHLGVGKAKQVDVRVTYPTGRVVTAAKAPVHQTVTVKDQ